MTQYYNEKQVLQKYFGQGGTDKKQILKSYLSGTDLIFGGGGLGSMFFDIKNPAFVYIRR